MIFLSWYLAGSRKSDDDFMHSLAESHAFACLLQLHHVKCHGGRHASLPSVVVVVLMLEGAGTCAGVVVER